MKTSGKTHKALKVLGIVAGAFAALVLVLQILLNSPVVTNIVNKAAAENIDGTMRFSRIHFSLIRSFPSIRVTVDTLSLTYPHDRFSAYDAADVPSRLLAAGRGELEDTLARFDRFTAAVNPWRIIGGKIRLRDAHLNSLDVYAHAFDTTANWNLFPASAAEDVDTTESKGISLPWISIGEIKLARRPRIVYTAQFDTLFAELGFKKIYLQGDYKLNLRDKHFSFRRVGFNIDSLLLQASLPADSLSLNIASFNISNPIHHVLDLNLIAEAFAWTGKFGKLDAPIELDGRIGFNQTSKFLKVVVPEMKANVAYIPLTLNGFTNMGDSTYVKASLGIPECDLETVWNKYGRNLYAKASDIVAKGHLSLDVKADGYLGGDVLPALELGVRLPDARAYYRPARTGGNIRLDLDASMDKARYVKADLSDLSIDAPGVGLTLKGKARDLLGKNPFFNLDADGEVVIDSLRSFLPSNMDASGDVSLNLKGEASLDELQTLNFDHKNIYGSLRSGKLEFRMPEDTLSTRVNGTRMDMSADSDGINIDLGLDSLTFKKGAGMRARIRGMNNNARLCTVESGGRNVPRLSASTHNGSVSFKSGTNRIFARGVDLDAALQKRVKRKVDPSRARRMSFRDSLNTEFKDRVISVSLDSTVARFFDEWNPSFSVVTKKAAVMTPALPLRTRVDALSCRYENNILSLDSLGVRCGTSDVFATGEIRGLRRILAGKKGMIRADLEVDSRRINANELLAALEKAKTLNVKDSEAEEDESFVVDSIAAGSVDTAEIKLIALPGNITANLGLEVAKAEYLDITATPLKAYVKLQDRTLQITSADVRSNIGNINADAFYATHSKDALYAGFNLKLSEISAYDIIHLIPTVDDMLPALKSFEGRLGCELSATTQLDTCMNVVIPTLDGLFKISGEDLTVNDLGAFKKVARLLLFKDSKVGHIQNMNVTGVIHDSKLELFPFELGVDRYALALEGTQNYDKSMKYHVSVMKSPLLIPFGVNMCGSLDKWRLSLGLAKYRSGRVPSYTAELDTMQINIVRSIRQIFRKGEMDAIRRSNASAVRRKFHKDDTPELEINSAEYQQIDSLFLSHTEEELNRSVEEETNQVLADAMKEAEEMNSRIEANVISNAEKRRMRSEASNRRKNERY